MQGISFNSHWSATGLVVSGVAWVSIRLMPSFKIKSCATSAARLGLDWLSLVMISIWTGLPLLVMPASVSFRPAKIQSCASPKPAKGPVVGATKPILNTPSCAKARLARKIAGAAISPVVAVMNLRRV